MLTTLLASGLTLLFGLAFLFFGYRLFLLFLPIWGFFAGFWLGAYGIELLFGGGFLSTALGWIVGFVVGIIGAVLSYLFYALGIAWIAFSIGASIGGGVMGAIGFAEGLVTSLVAIASGVVVAGLTFLLNVQKYVIIILASLAGASLVVTSGLLLFGRLTTEQLAANGNPLLAILRDSWFWLIVWLLLASFGAAIQIWTTRGFQVERAAYVETRA